MTAIVLRADARQLPLPDASVDLIVTSPPYWSLRSYTDGGEHYAAQIGSEDTPAAYVDSLIACTSEWMRVLKPTGSIFVNLGDKYALRDGQGGPQGKTGQRANRKQAATYTQQAARSYAAPPKSLLMLPERYRIACVDRLGLTVREVLVWSKPNAMPESVTDRARRSHEDWVHLTVGPRYYADVDAIRTAHARIWEPGSNGGHRPFSARGNGHTNSGMEAAAPHTAGALPGSVWEIATEPLKVPVELGVDHFAAFPMEWPRRLILGWSPKGICTRCSEPRRPLTTRTREADRPGRVQGRTVDAITGGHGTDGRAGSRYRSIVTNVGETCACPEPTAPTRPAVVLDPFGGTGTTALVASVFGRTGITVDRSADYCRIAAWRTTDPGQRAKALRGKAPRPKPATKAAKKPSARPEHPVLFELAAP